MNNIDKHTMRYLNDIGCSEITKVTTYNAVIKDSNDHPHEIAVQIFDSGEDTQERYFVVANRLDEPLIVARGNPAGDLETALHIVHWQDLKQ